MLICVAGTVRQVYEMFDQSEGRQPNSWSCIEEHDQCLQSVVKLLAMRAVCICSQMQKNVFLYSYLRTREKD
jgi:hypothetical protein